MKIKLEINFVGKTTYLNSWDSMYGNDVICQIVGDKIFLLSQYDDGKEPPPKEITLSQFVRMVKRKPRKKRAKQ